MPTPPETTDRPNDDDFLLERLGALIDEIDPVPSTVIDDARAAFGQRTEISEPGPRGGAAIEPSLLSFDLHTV